MNRIGGKYLKKQQGVAEVGSPLLSTAQYVATFWTPAARFFLQLPHSLRCSASQATAGCC